MGLDLSEARASLLSGDVIELTNATSTDSTSMKLVWEVSYYIDTIFHIIHVIILRNMFAILRASCGSIWASNAYEIRRKTRNV